MGQSVSGSKGYGYDKAQSKDLAKGKPKAVAKAAKDPKKAAAIKRRMQKG